MSDTKLLAKDLRIGNLVYGPLNELCVVDQIGRYDNPEYVAYHELNNLVSGGQNGQRPIPLSEDVLIKLGFQYFPLHNSYQLDSDLGFAIWGRIETGFYVYCDGNEIGNTMMYIHEIQNCFHSLTGEELKFTENKI